MATPFLSPVILLITAGTLTFPLRAIAQGLGPEPPVPADRLELVANDAQLIQDVTERAALVALVSNALQRSNVRANPYHQKTAFTTFGSSSSDGVWKLEDMSNGLGAYRWTADGPSFSIVNLFLNRNLLYSNQPSAILPLRLAQVRAAIFFKSVALGPRAALRSAEGSLDGTEVTCALISYGPHTQSGFRGRRWEEAEYCVDPKSGNLITYSPVPGAYVLFDYSKAIQFHDKVIPNKFTLTQGGQAVIECQINSVNDPPTDPAPFEPSGLQKVGVGAIMTQPWRYPLTLGTNKLPKGDTPAVVVLHAVRSPEGKLTDVELITSTNPALNTSALTFAANWGSGPPSDETEPGATPQFHEVFLTLRFINGARPVIP